MINTYFSDTEAVEACICRLNVMWCKVYVRCTAMRRVGHGEATHSFHVNTNNFAFWKNDPLRENFENSVPTESIASPIDALCANFVIFGRRESGKAVRYLHVKKISARPPALAIAQIAPKICRGPWPAPNNVGLLRVLQVSSKSVYFRRSYIRTREQHQSAS